MIRSEHPSRISRRRSRGEQGFLARFTLYRLSVANMRAERILVDQLQTEIGLSLAEWRLMLIVGESPGLSTDAVATQTTMAKAKVSRAISRLSALGLVNRKVHSTDRRLNVLSITPKGKRVFERCRAIAKLAQKQLLSSLTNSESKTLHELLTKLG